VERASYNLPPLSAFKIRWSILILLILVHIGAVAAFWFFTWPAFFTFLGLYVLTGMLGITVGYHRLLAHRSFETYRWVRAIHVLLGVLAMQLGPLTWARLHRAHHARSDGKDDPHPQIYGFWYGHMAWAFLSHPDIGKAGMWKESASDLRADPLLKILEKYYIPILAASLIALFAIGGWPFLLWAGAFRIVWVLHITWCVNSVCHRFGYRNFDTKDFSVNSWPIGLLAWGEGWHNNHHRYPNSARHGLRWFEIDASWLWIRMLKLVGLAWSIKTPALLAEESEPEIPNAISQPPVR